MSGTVIYIARPTSARGLWRMTTNGRAEQFLASEHEAIEAAVWLAKFFRSAGEDVVVKLEAEDGTWSVIRS